MSLDPRTWFKKQSTAPTDVATPVAPMPAADDPTDAPKQLDTIVSMERPQFGNMGGAWQRINLDTLVSKKTLTIYDTMRLDEQVKAAVTFKRDAILSRGWTFEFDPDSKLSDAEKAKRKRVSEQIIRKLPGSFIDSLNIIAVGREYGYSLTEKVYTEIEVDGKTYVGLAELAGRSPLNFWFYTDPFGTLIKCEQQAGGMRIPIDLDKFIHYVHNPEFDKYFGRSDLREAYRSWYFKEMMIRFWGLYMEKLGGGVVIASLGPDAQIQPNTPNYTALQNAISQMKASPSVVLPVGVTAQVVFPQTSDAFEKACTWHDLAIAKALLVPNLAGVSHTGQTGSHSQAQTQMEAFAWTLKADAERLQACVDEQLFKDLGEQNWGDGDYPCFTFKPLSGEQLKWMIETWIALVGAGAVLASEIDEDRLREILEMPARDPSAKLLKDPNAVDGPNAAASLADQNAGIAKDKAEHAFGLSEKGKNADIARQAQAAADAQPDPKKKAATYAAAALEATVRLAADERHLRRSAAPINKPKLSLVSPNAQDARINIASIRERTDFAVINAKQTSLSTQVSKDAALSIARAVKKLLGTDEEVKSLTDSDTHDIANVTLDSMAVGRLKAAFQKALIESYALGARDARNELRKSKKSGYTRDAQHFADIRDNAAGYFDSNGFRMAGNASDATRAVIQQELLNSVKIGRSPAQTRTAIWDRLVAKGLSSREAVQSVETDSAVNGALDALWVDDEVQAAHYLDTLARTNLFEAMNEARYAEFTDPALGDFVVAFRYSAILDDRTTEICTALHDSVYKSDNPLWDEFRPPNHYNCRSILVPITQLDVQDGEWDGVESDDPSVQPQAGFGA